MKKIDLNLTTAFTLRKRIKEISTRLHRELAMVRYMDEPESKQDQLDLLTYGDVEKQLVALNKYLNAVESLSDKIDSENAKGKTVLNKLNRINTELQIASVVANGLNGIKQTQKSRNPVTGVWEVNKLEPVTNYDIDKHIELLKQEKVRAEDDLAKINASTNFKYEIDEEIYNTIYGE